MEEIRDDICDADTFPVHEKLASLGDAGERRMSDVVAIDADRHWSLFETACKRIAALEAERDRLREALRDLVVQCETLTRHALLDVEPDWLDAAKRRWAMSDLKPCRIRSVCRMMSRSDGARVPWCPGWHASHAAWLGQTRRA
jgi:hypothetical protein